MRVILRPYIHNLSQFLKSVEKFNIHKFNTYKLYVVLSIFLKEEACLILVHVKTKRLNTIITIPFLFCPEQYYLDECKQLWLLDKILLFSQQPDNTFSQYVMIYVGRMFCCCYFF